MAAVLCKGCAELCVLPFKCCASSCKLCNDICGDCCKGVGDMCQNLCRNPFCSFVTVAVCTQLPAAILFIPAIGGIPGCQGSLWLLANAALALINVFTAFYLAYRVVDTSNPAMSHLDTAFKRSTYLLCNDYWMAIYICVFIGFMAVQAWGASFAVQNSLFGGSQQDIEDDDVEECADNVNQLVSIGSSLGWAFVFLGFMALLFSMCCARFDVTDYSQPPPSQGSSPDVEAQYSNNQNYNSNPNPPQYQANAYGTAAPAAGKASSTTYTQNGIPTNDFVNSQNDGNSGKKYSKPSPSPAPPPQQEEIPMAYAEEIPQQASAPPAEYDNGHSGSGAPPTSESQGSTAKVGGKVGGTAGKQIGKLFTKDEAKQQKIQQQGKKAGEAVEMGLLTATNFVKSKLKKEDGKK